MAGLHNIRPAGRIWPAKAFVATREIILKNVTVETKLCLELLLRQTFRDFSKICLFPKTRSCKINMGFRISKKRTFLSCVLTLF